jgi:hypothetical protein
MTVAMRRDAAAESFVGIAQRLGMSPSTPKKQYRLHIQSMDTPEYAEACAGLISDAIRALHGDLAETASG